MPYATTRVELGERSYSVYTGTGLILRQDCDAAALLQPLLQDRRVLAVIDGNVAVSHGARCMEFLRSVTTQGVSEFILRPGEEYKTLSAVESICNAAAENHLDRASVFVGIGGGVTGDLAAFAASIYMRGVRFVQIPTSLLAMLDSSVGGKTGADLTAGKNMVGTFYQPRIVLMDPIFLTTLPRVELRNGIAELIKHAVLFDSDLFELLLSYGDTLFDASNCVELVPMIVRSVQWKAAVVMRDERESGERKLLNLGHTFGHAIEKESDYTGYRHGECVAIGMLAAARLAELSGFAEPGIAERIRAVIQAFRLPGKVTGLSPASLLRAMHSDKKNRNGNLCLILPHRIGHCEIHTDIDEQLVLQVLETICG